MELDQSAASAGVRLIALDTVGSTNSEARQRARRGESGPLWITAKAQTEGRGRGDRSWYSPPGNLFASLLLPNPSAPERAPELAFVVALAVRDAIVAADPALAPRLLLKWPNDLLLAGEKCAEILIEGEVEPPTGMSVVIGIGVNCAHHPPPAEAAAARAPPPKMAIEPGVLYPATDLRSHGVEVTAEQLFARLSATMCKRIAQWDRGRGFAAILGDWLMWGHGIGDPIRVRNGRGEKTGRFVGLDASGRLVLELPGGKLEKISAGDVFPFADDDDRRRLRRQAE
jgi:BirA family transcriptional regulator, biotin operon repressor / biotin---[acetyl-CoA-carboxylase] ligase